MAASRTRVRGAGHRAVEARAKSTRRASHWVLAVAILQTLFGFGAKAAAGQRAEAALADLAGHEESHELVVDNEIWRIGDLRRVVEREHLVEQVPLGLGLVFFALWFWARFSPLPALATALCLFAAVTALAVLERPALLLDGIYLQCFCAAGLLGGVRSALESRRVEAALASQPVA